MVYVVSKDDKPLMDIEGSKIDFSDMPKGWKTPKLSNCKRISARKTWIVDECMVA